MLVIVVALFAFCWLPLQMYMVLQDIFPDINSYRYINIVFFCCDWLAMSNSCYNPFIYGIYNEKFKREFQQRFPFKSSKWRGHSVIDSMETERSFQAGRPSIRSTTTTVDCWKHNYSTRASKRSIRSANGNYLTPPLPSSGIDRNVKNYYNRHSVSRENSLRNGKDTYARLNNNKSRVIIGCASDIELDELCL